MPLFDVISGLLTHGVYPQIVSPYQDSMESGNINVHGKKQVTASPRKTKTSSVKKASTKKSPTKPLPVFKPVASASKTSSSKTQTGFNSSYCWKCNKTYASGQRTPNKPNGFECREFNKQPDGTWKSGRFATSNYMPDLDNYYKPRCPF